MKTKNKTICALLVASLTFSSVFANEEMSIPQVTKPSLLEEGTQRELTLAQINDILPWAKDSKNFLVDLLENIEGLSMSDKVERLVEGISGIVEQSTLKHSELLMRYALNRGLVIHNVLSKEMDADAVGSIDAKFRVLKSSVLMAIKYYETDMAVLTKKSVSPFVLFGLDYYSFLTELNKSIFDASAQYQVQRTSLEWLQWDLYRDVNNARYAAQIVKINNGLKVFPNKKLTDSQSISHIRQMKGLAKQLNIIDTLRKLELDRELTLARNEAERLQILQNRAAEEARQAQLAEEARIQNELRELNDGKEVKQAILSSGNLVIATGNSVRTVEYTTDNNQVVLQAETYAYNQTVVKRNDVQKAYSSHLGLRTGMKVLYGNTVRSVEYIGEKGMVSLAAEAYVYNRNFVDFRQISRTVGSYNQYNVGDSVLFGGNIRQIEYLDNGGRVVLKAVTYSFNQNFTTVENIAKAIR